MDRGAIEICRALNLDRNESIEDLLTTKVPQWIEKLSRIYQLDRKFLDGSRSYRDKVQKSRWIEIAIISIETRRQMVLIDSLAVKRCPVTIEIA